MSYTLDVYRGKLKPTRHFFDFALFVAFFPQLVAGPIERAIHLLPQIINPRRQNLPMFLDGCKLILVGYFKKVVIADNFAVIADRVFNNPDQYSGLAVVFGVYAFAFQIYGDFSGYSDIARGISCLIGIDLMPNFRMPYFSQNPQEFWRRWHISLSSWLRDYLYIPLGGNKYGTAHTYRNLMLTMVLGGLWHGAAWKFVFWGTYQGALLCVHRVFMEWRKNASVLPSPVKMFVFFQLTCFGWVLFRINRIADLPVLMNNMFRLGGVPLEWLASMCFLLAPLLCVEIAEERSGQVDGTAPFHPVVRLLQYAVFVFFICLFGRESGYEFIYFQF
jgi:D-alanyl-lipoteichoic acid acyltransferase DltB (MBOAT superfamily)